jgi:hypothetical protein
VRVIGKTSFSVQNERQRPFKVGVSRIHCG